jgi:LPXTG-site transpeptidase (sortase) family protein
VSLVFLLAGIAVGVYYHSEIMVWIYALTQHEQVAVETALPSVAPETSVLEMKLLEDPLPLVFSETLDEPKLQEYLKEGAVVLPLGTTFGEKGNVVITAHSTGTTSFGPYRFAFAKLSELKAGDEFTIRTPKGTFTYKVFGDEIVWPTEVDKLPNDDRSTVTLVTCWPLWTNFKRLLVHGELVNVAYN